MQKLTIRTGTLGTLLGLVALGCTAQSWEEPGSETDIVDQVHQNLGDALSLAEADGQIVRLVSRQTQKCMDVSGAGSANGTNIQLWDCNGTNAQSFRVTPLGGGAVRFVNVGSNKCVDVSGASTENGANIHLWECNGTAAQSFYGTDVGGGFLSLTNSRSRKSLDVAAWGTSNGSNIQQWDFSWGDNQMWKLERVGSGDPVTTDPTGPVTLRVMSLNVWGHQTMPQEAGAYANLIRAQNVDVVGIQEGVHDWLLNTDFPTDYRRAEALGAALGDCFQRRYQVFVNVCRGNSIVGNDRFDLTDGPNATRTGEAVTIRKGGKSFGFIDVHWDHQDGNVNRANARETANRANAFGGMPVVVVGDFNTSCSGSNAGVMRSGASLQLDADAGIDCIFSRGATRQSGGRQDGGPSDHPSVVAQLTL